MIFNDRRESMKRMGYRILNGMSSKNEIDIRWDVAHLYQIYIFVDVDLNGMDGNLGDDSDSIGNTRNTRSSAAFTLPGREKRKPLFKKVSTCDVIVPGAG